MKVLAVDDDLLDLSRLIVILARLMPKCEILSVSGTDEALKLIKQQNVDALFLEAGHGINLARTIYQNFPRLPVVFVADDDRFLKEAFSVHAAGYLRKPVSPDDVENEINYLFTHQLKQKRLYIQTFGGFDVFFEGKLLTFRRSKAKELLAVLVDRRGGSITSREACALLFEEQPYSETQSSYFRVLVYDLSRTLKEAGIEYILLRKNNRLSLDISRFECDAYQFLEGEPEAVSRYNGDYMFCYSWAEYSSGLFEKKLLHGGV